MEQIKQLTNAVDSATSDMLPAPSVELYVSVEKLLSSRADMYHCWKFRSKHLIAHCCKRLMIKNRKVLFLTMDMLEYIGYQTELTFYSQVATKDFLLRLSGLLQAKDLNEAVMRNLSKVSNKILSTVKCWEELFKPHQDLLPMFFQFYDGLVKKGYDTKKDYVSPYRPKELKKYPTKAEQQKKVTSTASTYHSEPKSDKTSTNSSQSITSLKQQIILTNEVIDGSDPSESVGSNNLLSELMTGLKEGEKRMLKLINEESNQKLVEEAIAINDDLLVTFRRYKFLQQNKRPEPFIKTQLASNFIAKEVEEKPRGTLGPKPELPKQNFSKQASIFDDFDIKETVVTQPVKTQPPPPPQPQQKKVQTNLMDLDFEAPKPQPQPIRTNPPAGTSLFDMIDLNAATNNPPPPPPPAMNTMSVSMQPGIGTNSINFMGMAPVAPIPQSNIYGGPNLGLNNFGMLNPQPTSNSPPSMGLNLLGSTSVNTTPINPNGITVGPNLFGAANLPYEGNFSTEADFKQYNENSLTDLSDWFSKK